MIIEIVDAAASVTLSRQELTILVRALTEIAYGVRIPDWEFATLLGFPRHEARTLLHQLHPLLVRSGDKS